MDAQENDVVLDSLPDAVVAAMEVRDAWRTRKGQEDGLEFLISDLARWRPGSAVRVAFLDGDDTLHKDIADATKQIADACNLDLDFGDSGGKYRRWKTTDTTHAAEIRVSFDKGGFWSLVGTDSTDVTISDPLNGIGGGPGQRSLNLGGFTNQKPNRWQGTVRHEFLHALAFHHAHQNPRGSCKDEFRWEDDPGYVPTRDNRGVFVPDAADKRPGIYTYLGGPPNNWPRNKVDHNLRTVDSPDVIAGPFDQESVMLYQFQPFFYKNNPSDCAPTGDGINLSGGDKRGIKLIYPHTEADVDSLSERATKALEALTGEEATGSRSTFEQRVIDLLGNW